MAHALLEVIADSRHSTPLGLLPDRGRTVLAFCVGWLFEDIRATVLASLLRGMPRPDTPNIESMSTYLAPQLMIRPENCVYRHSL